MVSQEWGLSCLKAVRLGNYPRMLNIKSLINCENYRLSLGFTLLISCFINSSHLQKHMCGKEARNSEFGFLDDDRQEMIINVSDFRTQWPYYCFLGWLVSFG